MTAQTDPTAREPPADPRRCTAPSSALSGASEAFAPASPDRVWELLADPSRMAKWEPSIGGVEDLPTAVEVGDTWVALARTERPDGKPIPVKPGFIAQRVELTAFDEPRLIEWRFTYPQAPQANARRIRVELEPAAGGTQLRLALSWERDPNRPRRPVLGFIMRPARRRALWMQLSQLGNAVGRAFR